MVEHCACSKDGLMLHWLGCSICYIGEFVSCIAGINLMGVDLIGVDILVSFLFLVSFLKICSIWWNRWEYWHHRILIFSRSTRSKLSGPSFFPLWNWAWDWSVKSVFPITGAMFGICIHAETLIHENVLNFRWNTIDFGIAKSQFLQQ